jgi:hypothetical protein
VVAKWSVGEGEDIAVEEDVIGGSLRTMSELTSEEAEAEAEAEAEEVS